MQIKLSPDDTEEEVIDTCLDIINASEEVTDLDKKTRDAIKKMCHAYLDACIKAVKSGQIPLYGLPFLILGNRDAIILACKASSIYRHKHE